MKIKALVPYFGGKRSLAPKIVELIGKHQIYWEPFCGSMAVLLLKPPCVLETVSDLHGDLINLARVVQDKESAFKLYDKLSRTLYVEKFFAEAMERWIKSSSDYDGPDIDRAYDFFIISWLGLNGVSGTQRINYQFAMRWCIGGGQGARRWVGVLESLPAWHQRLQNVVILQRDAFEIINNIKDEHECVIYCDPPYLEKSDKYVHDFTEQQHRKLAELLQRFQKSRVIVSYYDNVILSNLYPDWEKIYFKKTRQSLRNATRGKQKKPRLPNIKEVLLLKNFQKGLFNADFRAEKYHS